MKKLKLQIDNLAVESFGTAETHDELRGTVDAQGKPTRPEPCLANTNITGACCEYTWASCVQTNCIECMGETATPCA